MRVASGVKERDEIKRARERRVRDARAGCDIRGLERSGGGTTLDTGTLVSPYNNTL